MENISSNSSLKEPYLSIADYYIQQGQKLSDEYADILWEIFYNCLDNNKLVSCEKLLSIFDPKNPENKIMKHILRASLYLRRGETDRALRILESASAVKVPPNPKNYRLKAYAYYLLGNLFSKNKNKTRAIESYNMGIKLCDKAINLSRGKDIIAWKYKIKLLLELGKELKDLEKYKDVIQILFEALRATSHINKLTRGKDNSILISRAEILLDIGKNLFLLGDTDGALESLAEAVYISEKILRQTGISNRGTWLLKAKALYETGKILVDVGDKEYALSAFDNAVYAIKQVYHASSSQQEKIEALNLLLDLALDLEELCLNINATNYGIKVMILALYLAKQLYSLGDKTSDKFIGGILSQLGFLFLDQEDLQNAEKSLCLALRLLDTNEATNRETKRIQKIVRSIIKQRKFHCKS